jgi:hypothetical protein
MGVDMPRRPPMRAAASPLARQTAVLGGRPDASVLSWNGTIVAGVTATPWPESTRAAISVEVWLRGNVARLVRVTVRLGDRGRPSRAPGGDSPCRAGSTT